MRCLAEVAERKGINYFLPNWTDVACDPGLRLELLKETGIFESEHVVLVGSSFGGYVSALAAEEYEIDGLFLLVPILAKKRNEKCRLRPRSKEFVIIQASEDEYTDPRDVVDFANASGADLHLLSGGHSLEKHLALIDHVFEAFLDKIAGDAQQIGGINSESLRSSP